MKSISINGQQDMPINSIFCIGRNYARHAAELNNEVPQQPMVFLKPTSSIIFDGDAITLPHQSNDVHHEVELVVAIGRKGKHIPEANALDYVAGYGIGIDITARDIQQKAKEKSHPWTVAKGFDTFAPVSTFVSVKEVEDPQNLDLSISVNGEIRQQANTAHMLFPVKKLISYLSSIFTLHPGDLIFTGTPQGVSPIHKGDTITAILQPKLATLSVHVSED